MSGDVIRFEIAQDGLTEDVAVSTSAMALVASCINEALEAVNDWEFSIRLGFTTDEARDLLEQVNAALSYRERGHP